MTTEDPPTTAKPGDELDAASMTRAASELLNQASDVARRLGAATKQSDIDQLLSRHEQLVAAAITLNSGAIALLAGEAKVQGQAVADQIAEVNATVKKIASLRRALGVLDGLLGFVAAVLTGNGTAIVKAGIKLKGSLKGPSES